LYQKRHAVYWGNPPDGGIFLMNKGRAVMTNSPDMRGNGSGGDERFAGQLPRIARRDSRRLPEQSSESPLGRNQSASAIGDMSIMSTMLEPPPVSAPSTSLNDLDSFGEPVFPPAGWLDDASSGSLADHPLLRGLLLELPAKGTVLAPGWLDRWFEAARSILELLYQQQAAGNQQRR
jgi:hypothetical protein